MPGAITDPLSEGETMPTPAGTYESTEVWEVQLQALLDAHPGRGGKTVVAKEIGVSRQLLNVWLPTRATGRSRQAPNYYNRIKIQAAWERIVKPRLEQS
jgi:hypothetical protein